VITPGKVVGLGTLVTLPRLVTPASHFARTIILARMLSPRDLGIAIAVTVLLSTAELISDFGLDRYLISRPPAEDAPALAVAHCLQLIRGLALALIILVSAPLIAELFGEPGIGGEFRWCALILLVRDAAHLEIRQIQRDFRYTPEAMVILLARGAALLAVYPAASALGDARAMIAILFVDAIVYAAASHIAAKRRYRIGTGDRRIWHEALAFSLPLTLNGIGLAASSQLDRALVSHWFGVATLALYSLVLNLAVVPASIIHSAFNLLSVSLLAQASPAVGIAKVRYDAINWGHAVAALAYAIGVASTLDLLVPQVFGTSYAVEPWAVILVSLIVLVRIIRGAPIALLLAMSQTRHLMIANMVSIVGLLLAVALLPLRPQIETMLFCVLVGDTMSYGFMLSIVRRMDRLGMPAADRPIWCAFALAIVSTTVLQIAVRDAVTWRLSVGGAAILLVAGYAAFGFHRHFVKNGLLTAVGQHG
jgi:O-antigen/teichoic acid export membrane protein